MDNREQVEGGEVDPVAGQTGKAYLAPPLPFPPWRVALDLANSYYSWHGPVHLTAGGQKRSRQEACFVALKSLSMVE
ncbi:MAG: hypothetical protein ACLVKS_03480 [Peptococcus niger]